MNVTKFDELRELWPKDESGLRCRDLVVAFLTEKLIQTAKGADCNPVSAQGEAAANKSFATLIENFRGITVEVDPAATGPAIKPLNRFAENHEAPATK